jgi:hypothetical protein
MAKGVGVRIARGALLAALGAGCGGSGATPPPGDVDVLFMIDDSSSTNPLKTNLTKNFPGFISTLRALPGGLPNLHLAVITSDMGAGDGSVASCSGAGKAGIFQYTARGSCTATNLEPGATFVSDVDGVKNYSGSLEDVFTCIAQVGDTGCGFEQPLGAVMRALGADGQAAPAENAGFVRPNALLFVVLVTNEDDCSVPPGSSLFDTVSNNLLEDALGPVMNFRCNEFGHLCNGAKPPRLAPNGSMTAMVPLTGCTSAETSGMLTPVATFVSQLRALKANPDKQILVAAIAGPTSPYTVNWKAPSLADTGPWPVIAHSCTASDGSFGDPGVRIADWVSAFGAAGSAENVCSPSYGPILDTLARRLRQAVNALPR